MVPDAHRRLPGPGQARLLPLVALSAFAVAQPLLDLIEQYPDFLVAHHAAPVDVVLLVVLLVAGPPLLLFAVARGAGRLSRRAGAAVDGLLVAVLATLLVLPWAGRYLAGVPALALSVVVGALFAFALARSPRLREYAAFFAASAVIFPALFFADSRIRSLVIPTGSAAVEAPRVREDLPVVLVVFDELPLSSLIGADGGIDRERFPAFASLADHATWFRNATAVAAFTQQAVPAILTGRYPGRRPKLAIASEQPYNLFSLLAGSHQLNVHESQTQLADPALLPRPPLSARLVGLFEDLAVVYLHAVLPGDLARDLPPVDEGWTGYRGAASIGRRGAGRDGSARGGHPAFFRRFVASIGPAPTASLHFIHSGLPHRPWRYLPSGNVYFPTRQHGLSVGFRTTGGAWWQQEACQRHLLQVQYVDRLLGQLLDRLRALALYERALVIVTADHGVAFWPDDNARMVGRSDHPEDILGIPLLIKRPGQRRGAVDDRNVETVDVLPTIAGLVGAQLGQPRAADAGFVFDGCSLYDPSCPERPEKVAYWSDHPTPEFMQELRFDAHLGLRGAALRQKRDWFGQGLHRFGPFAPLVGRRLADLSPVEAPAGRVVPDVAGRPPSPGPGEALVPVRVSGLLELDGEPETPPHVAVATGERIRTVVPAPADGAAGRRVLAMIPEAALVEGERPSFYLVTGSPDAPRLQRLDSGSVE